MENQKRKRWIVRAIGIGMLAAGLGFYGFMACAYWFALDNTVALHYVSMFNPWAYVVAAIVSWLGLAAIVDPDIPL